MPFATGAAMLLTAGFIYEQAGEWRDRREFPQVGRAVDIGGRSLNIYCSGSGSPAVVFESGDVRPGYSWFPVQREVAAMTRACWYDRAGYGWSDAAPRARTGANIVEDLHRLLHAAGVAPPYVLVGQSFGGFNVRVFADRYRGEVSGLVLVDSADEFEEPDRIPVSLLGSYWEYVPYPLWGVAAGVSSALGHLGVARLMDGGPGAARGGLSARETATIHSLQIQAKSFDAYLREGLDRDQTTAQVRAIRGLGDIPLVVLSGAGNRQARTQARLAALSTRGRVATPEAVAEAVREVLDRN
jgi:pimeloyl-ACP methyl ester carboxylesterase